jgi:hypothetical protein
MKKVCEGVWNLDKDVDMWSLFSKIFNKGGLIKPQAFHRGNYAY